MGAMSGYVEKLKDYHRRLRPKRGDELSMKQVACSFGGLYAIIHLMQYFDLLTILIFATVGYIIYRQAQNAFQVVTSASEDTGSQQEAPQPKTKQKGSKKARGDAQATRG